MKKPKKVQEKPKKVQNFMTKGGFLPEILQEGVFHPPAPTKKLFYIYLC